MYMLTLLTKGAKTKLLKFFCLKIFSICHRCRWHRWCTLSREYLREFSKKFEMAVMVHSDASGKLIHEKNQKSKISWHCPFKYYILEAGGHFYVALLKKKFFRWSVEPLICRAFGTASVLRTSTTHGWSREPLMCSTLMFGTLKLGLIDLQSAPQ